MQWRRSRHWVHWGEGQGQRGRVRYRQDPIVLDTDMTLMLPPIVERTLAELKLEWVVHVIESNKVGLR